MSTLPFPLSAGNGSGPISGAANRPDSRYRLASPDVDNPMSGVDPRCLLGGLMTAGSALAAVLFLFA